MKYTNGLFIFRRDLRLIDNIGLNSASKQCEKLYTTFYFTPEQVLNNKYKSENAVQFMIESLFELEKDIKELNGELIVLLGEHLKILDMLCSTLSIEAIFFNKDYSPYSMKRDEIIVNYCKSKNIKCFLFQDYYLYKPEQILTSTNKPFQKYTPFYNIAIKEEVMKPNRIQIKNLTKNRKKLKFNYSLDNAYSKLIKKNDKILVNGGRINGKQRLRDTLKEQEMYDDKRDNLNYNTSFLSAYIKFGCISIREVYNEVKKKFGIKHGIIRELIWREFFANILYHYPEVLKGSYHYKDIKWKGDIKNFKKWCEGKTGFPVVDAGMRQLNETGYMHNRCRMITATFLVKTLLLDWRLGEKYFAQRLTDYDPASNNGNWQGISSTGVDMKPYFRTMNPWIQSKKFDKNCEYIKKWIPELKDVSVKDIHNWYSCYNKYNTYVAPIADYKETKEKMMQMYKEATF